MITEENIYFNT